MSVEENEAVGRRYVEEVWNRHDLANIDEFVSPDHLNHAASSPEYRRARVAHAMGSCSPPSPTPVSTSRTP